MRLLLRALSDQAALGRGAVLAAAWVLFGAFMLVIVLTHPAVGKGNYGMVQRISAAGLAHIKHFEGCKLKSYYCIAGRCTIGYGSTGPHVKPGMVITEAQAEELLRQDLDKAERAVAELVKVPLSSGQHAALVDLVFNVGAAAVAKSTLLKLLNKKQYAEAGEQLMRWVHSGSAVIAGLQRRRLAARQMWFTPG
jgi:lysozyme